MTVNPGFFRTELLTEESTQYAELKIDGYSERRAQQEAFWTGPTASRAATLQSSGAGSHHAEPGDGASPSFLGRRRCRRHGRDPWNGRTLEWSTSSPPPAWNFAVLPQVTGRDAFWSSKLRARHDQPAQARAYQPIEMPKNSAIGFVTAFFAVVTGFALIWHIWWMASLGLFGAFVTFLIFAFRREEEIEIPASRLANFDRTHPVEVPV